MKKDSNFDYDRDVLNREVITNVSDKERSKTLEVLKSFPQLFISDEAFAKNGQPIPNSFAVVLTPGETVDIPEFFNAFLNITTWELNYGDEILYPLVQPSSIYGGIRSYSPLNEVVLVPCTIDIDYMFPNDERELTYGLSSATYKVTITPISEDDQVIFGRERTYFSDIESKILKHNPQFKVRPYPKELTEISGEI